MSQRNKIYVAVTFITALLLLDIIFTSYNNSIIKHNRALQVETVRVKIYYDQVGKLLIHALDLGLRGYAITQDDKMARPMDNALAWQDSIFQNIELPLRSLHYNLRQFNTLKDSVNAYAKYCFTLKQLIAQNHKEEFLLLFKKDRGASLWWQYILCERSIIGFIDRVNDEAQHEYEQALFRNFLLQIVLFSITVPTLFYTARKAQSAFALSQKLHHAEAERNKILNEQNLKLEREVAIRTHELASQNEEIRSQSEELTLHRDLLEEEIRNRTRELEDANRELIENNNQLEQFSFTAAHNLRAPLARILGLANIILVAKENEKTFLLQKILFSATELDTVIKELSSILDIKKHTSSLTEVDLQTALDRVVITLRKEIDETQTVIKSIFEVPKIYGITSYVDSILFNLISNAIKFRDEKRTPVITITSTHTKEHVVLLVKDNGVGIDLDKYEDKLFGLYKRFHFNVEGRGLGLYITRIQIMAIGGKIEVQSQPLKGTTFRIYLKPVANVL